MQNVFAKIDLKLQIVPRLEFKCECIDVSVAYIEHDQRIQYRFYVL